MRYLLVLVLLLAACGGAAPQPTATRQPAAPPAVPRATGSDAEAFAQQACLDSRYSRCVNSMLTVLTMAESGQLVAVCDFEQGEGDIVLIDDESEAESACSGGGLITPSSVANVVELP